jgi:predicted ester cyclase
MSTEENKALLRRLVEEVFSAQGDLDVADEIYAPNYVGHNPLDPEDVRGPEGAKEQARMYRSAFPDVRLSIEEQVAEGDKVVTRWIGSGTHQGEMMGIAPTGNQIRVDGITISRIQDGKVVEDWELFNALGLMQQLGGVPTPEEAQA